MKIGISCILLWTVASVAPGAELFVAPGGDDANPGSIEKPLATIRRAQQAARRLAGNEPVTVTLRAGTYYLAAPIVLTPDDSGTAEKPVVYRAHPGEKVKLSGGRRLVLSWEAHQGNVMKAAVDRAAVQKLAFDQLFINGRRQPMARLPNDQPDANVFEELDTSGEWFLDRRQAVLYYYPPPETDLAGAVVEVANLKELVVLEGTSERPVRHVRLEGFELVHAARTVLEPHEPLLRGDWSICRLSAVRMHGTEDCAVRDCFFNQLGGGGVLFDGYNRRSEVTGSRFEKLGASGVSLVGSYDAVRSGAIGHGNDWPEDRFDATPGPKTPNYPAECRVYDCLVYDIGRTGKQAAGVLISMSESITVSHTTIFSVPQSGIAINDGCWGGHVIEHNDVFDTATETDDLGPLSSWGRDRYWKTAHHGVKPWHDSDDAKGQKLAKARALLDSRKTTVIRNNRFWHSGGHSWGIDLDDGSTNYRIYQNLTLGCGLRLREGFLRRVENNVFFGSVNVHACFDQKEDVFERNIVVVPAGQPVYKGVNAKPLDVAAWDNNLYWSADGAPATFVPGSVDPRLPKAGAISFERWQAAGLDEHSLLADPRFVNPAGLDFQVRPDSPAVNLGFENFRMDQFGVITPKLKKLALWGHRTANGHLHPEILDRRKQATQSEQR